MQAIGRVIAQAIVTAVIQNGTKNFLFGLSHEAKPSDEPKSLHGGGL